MRILKEDEALCSPGRTSTRPAKGNCIPLAPAPHSAKTIANVEDLLKKPYLNEFEVAALTGIAVSTLRNNRHLRRGFPYLRVGLRGIRYKTSDTVAGMESRRSSFD